MSFESEVSPGAVRQLREIWEGKTSRPLGAAWNAAFADWIKKFGLPLVTDAVQAASIGGYSDDGERLPADIRDVPRYAAVAQAEAKEPGMGECYLARGRMRKKFFCADNDEEVLALLRRVMRAGVSAHVMHQAIEENNTAEDCFVSLGIDRAEFRIAMGQSIVNLLPKCQVFVSEEDPEWLIWNDYLRKTTGRGAPMNKNFGWFFPTRVPPVDDPPKSRERRSSGRE